MNKKIISAIIFAQLFCLPALVLADGATLSPPPGVPTSFPDLLLKIAQGVGELVASLAVIMIIWAGILYLTSGGSPEKINKAKAALTYAIIGIIVGLAATGIVQIILGIIK